MFVSKSKQIMRDWLFKDDQFICDVRVAGVLIRGERILLQRERDGNEYALPGGHIRIGEMMSDGLVREFIEETGAQITCKKLLWTEECFWENVGRMIHSISFYYLAELCSDADMPDDGEWITQKDNENVLLGWVPIDSLESMTVYPEFIKQTIYQLDAPTAHFVTHA